MAPSIAI
jgi:hypothetical protein